MDKSSVLIFNLGAHFVKVSHILSNSDVHSETCQTFKILTMHKKWNFSLSIPSINVTKSAGNCGFGHIYWRNPYWKTFLYSGNRFMDTPTTVAMIRTHFVSHQNLYHLLYYFSANIYLLKVNNRNTKKKVWNMFKVNNKNTRPTTTFWILGKG